MTGLRAKAVVPLRARNSARTASEIQGVLESAPVSVPPSRRRCVALLKIDPARHSRLAAAANESPGDYAINLFRDCPQQARPSQIDALSNRRFQSQRRFGPQMGEESNKRYVRTAGRWVFEDTMKRRKHPRLKVGALFCVLDI